MEFKSIALGKDKIFISSASILTNFNIVVDGMKIR